jgi:hypothetical protein
MNLEDQDNNEFSLPTELVDNLYELSGGPDKYKGVIIAVSSENGKPLVYTKFDCGMTELALVKTLEDYIRSMQEERKVNGE